MSLLDDFIKLLYDGSGNPATSYFLPTLILEQAPPLEPFAIADYAWGDISATSADLPGKLCDAVTAGSICTPGTAATLSLSQMQVAGLSNVRLGQPTVSGSRVTAVFEFGHAQNLPPGVSVPKYLEIQGNFAVSLSCCASQDGHACSGAPSQPPVAGTFAVGFGNATLTVTLDVQTTDLGDKGVIFTVTAQGVSLACDPPAFAFQAGGLAGPALNKVLREAFNANAGPAVVTIINQRLAAPKALAALSAYLSGAFTSLKNQSILSVTAYVLYGRAVDPKGAHYLPEEIKQATNPVLDPFSAGGWPFDDIRQWLPTAGDIICNSIGGAVNEDQIQTPGTPVQLTLSGIQISGTSNVMASPPLVVGNSIYGMVTCNAIADWPQTLTISGEFSLTVNCCDSTDMRTCSGPSVGNTGSGTFTATIAAAAVSIAMTISTSPDGKNLIATADAIYFRCEPNTQAGTNIQIDIAITSIPGGDGKVWSDTATGMFNSTPATTAFVSQIRQRLDQPVVRDKLSEIATQAIQSLMAEDRELARRLLREVTSAYPR